MAKVVIRERGGIHRLSGGGFHMQGSHTETSTVSRQDGTIRGKRLVPPDVAAIDAVPEYNLFSKAQ